jgi:hypothetical protein
MSLVMAIEAYQEAQRQAERVCADWTAACGPGVWREGHPSDLEKLRQRQRWRDHVAVSRETLCRALEGEPTEGLA